MKNQTSVAGVLLTTVRKNIPLTVLTLLAVAGTILTGILPPLVLERFVNNLTAGTVLLQTVLLYFGMLALSGLCDAAKESLITIFGQRVTHETRSAMSRKLNRLPAGYYTTHEPGDTASRFVGDVNTVESLFTSGIISMFVDACKMISVMAVIFTRSLGLGLLLVLVTPLLFLLTMRFRRAMLAAQKEDRKAVGAANQQIPETIHNIRTIRVLGREQYMEERYDRQILRSFAAQEKTNFYDAIYSPIIILTSAAVTAVMMTLAARGGSWTALFGMSVGSAAAIISYVGKIFDPLESIGMEITNIQSAVAGVDRINRFLSEPELPECSSTCAEGSSDTVVSVDGVTFAYDGDAPVLKDLSLSVRRGEMVTVAGRTGAGKSTLFKLLLGLYTPQQGSVRVFGMAPEEIPAVERRCCYGYVEQQFRMVPGTVADQVTLRDPSLTDADAERALRLTGLWDTVSALPQGMHTPCTAESFSQGQFQLLSIARAVAGEPELLLLDEITANLDSGTEAQVLAALQAAARNRTVLSISHRLYEASGGRIIHM